MNNYWQTVTCLANCLVATRIADRAYIYDNSEDNASARLLFRTSGGKLIKHYGGINIRGRWKSCARSNQNPMLTHNPRETGVITPSRFVLEEHSVLG